MPGFVHLWRSGQVLASGAEPGAEWKELGVARRDRKRFNTKGTRVGVPLVASCYLRRPSFPMICWYRVRSSRVRYFSRLLRLLTIFSRPRREE